MKPVAQRLAKARADMAWEDYYNNRPQTVRRRLNKNKVGESLMKMNGREYHATKGYRK